jgi:hypothetical protein
MPQKPEPFEGGDEQLVSCPSITRLLGRAPDRSLAAPQKIRRNVELTLIAGQMKGHQDFVR